MREYFKFIAPVLIVATTILAIWGMWMLAGTHHEVREISDKDFKMWALFLLAIIAVRGK